MQVLYSRVCSGFFLTAFAVPIGSIPRPYNICGARIPFSFVLDSLVGFDGAGGKIRGAVVQFQDEHVPVGMEASAGGCLRFFHRVFG
jgi:hypothetical protein